MLQPRRPRSTSRCRRRRPRPTSRCRRRRPHECGALPASTTALREVSPRVAAAGGTAVHPRRRAGRGRLPADMRGRPGPGAAHRAAAAEGLTRKRPPAAGEVAHSRRRRPDPTGRCETLGDTRRHPQEGTRTLHRPFVAFQERDHVDPGPRQRFIESGDAIGAPGRAAGRFEEGPALASVAVTAAARAVVARIRRPFIEQGAPSADGMRRNRTVLAQLRGHHETPS